MPRSSKRKRALRVLQAEIPDEDVDGVSAPEDDGEPEMDAEESQRQEENGDANHRFEVEAEIWDSFREEFHEGACPTPFSLLDKGRDRLNRSTAVEQLPLYLHRSYALLRELDQQVTGKADSLRASRSRLGTVIDTFAAFIRLCLGNYNQIHPTLQQYILLRRSLVGQGQQDPKPNGVVVKEQSPAPESEVMPASDTAGDSKPSPEPTEAHSGECGASASVPFRPNVAHTDPAPNTTRELLRHLGWLMEEVVRGSQEKVGLAQAAYDSVSRQFFSPPLRRAHPIDVTRTNFAFIFRRSTDTYASSTSPSANKKCPSPSASAKARTLPSSRTSPRPRAGPA